MATTPLTRSTILTVYYIYKTFIYHLTGSRIRDRPLPPQRGPGRYKALKKTIITFLSQSHMQNHDSQSPVTTVRPTLSTDDRFIHDWKSDATSLMSQQCSLLHFGLWLFVSSPQEEIQSKLYNLQTVNVKTE